MKRRNFNHKEQDSLQKIKHENEKLKRTVSSLRKQIARIDISRMENLQEIVHKYTQDVEASEILAKDTKKEQRWKCHDCEDGIMRLKVFERQNGIVYYRKCDKCDNRTKLQKWNKNVEGIE